MAQYTVDNCLPANTTGPPPSWPLKQSHLLDIVPIHSLKIQKRPFWLLGLNKLLKNQTLWGKKLDGRGSRFPHISKSGERMVNKYISNLIHPFRESGIELLSYSSIHQHHSSASAGASCVKLSAISSSSRSRSSSNSCSSSILCQIVQDQTESNFRFCWVCIVVHLCFFSNVFHCIGQCAHLCVREGGNFSFLFGCP